MYYNFSMCAYIIYLLQANILHTFLTKKCLNDIINIVKLLFMCSF